MAEVNEGYEIIAAETYNIRANDKEERVVLGRKEIRFCTMYVTWESVRHPAEEKADYFWGHYYDNETAARADYHCRLMEHYQ